MAADGIGRSHQVLSRILRIFLLRRAYAFSCLDDGQFNEPVAESAYRAAQDAMNGWDPSYGAIYYFNPSTATSKWIWSRPLIVNIGKHRFCS
jgi:N-acetylmuramoyl-L-alanine amidase